MCAIRERGRASINIQSDRDSRSDAMGKDTLNFAQQNTERAVQATNWMRAIAEHNLNQSKAAFEGLLTIARNAVRAVDQQAAAIREHSMLFADETHSNTSNFAHNPFRKQAQ